MQRSEQINELAAALAAVQAAIKPALKDSTNPHFKSKYADLGAVWDACRAPLAANGLSIVQMPAPAEPGHAALETLLMHASGQFVSNVAQVRLVKDDAQGAGSAYTYLRRYALSAFVGVVADEDDDGNAASQAPRRESAPARPAAFAPPKPDASERTDEGARRFYARYGTQLGGAEWSKVQTLLGNHTPAPETFDGWVRVGEAVRDALEARAKNQSARANGRAMDSLV